MEDDDIETKPPRVIDPPAEIWLVYGDIERDATHSECASFEDSVTWCSTPQYDSDVRYVHESASREAVEKAVVAERERCAQWLRENYQANQNIASLCDAMMFREPNTQAPNTL